MKMQIHILLTLMMLAMPAVVCFFLPPRQMSRMRTRISMTPIICYLFVSCVVMYSRMRVGSKYFPLVSPHRHEI
jgi:hypothetical protein